MRPAGWLAALPPLTVYEYTGLWSFFPSSGYLPTPSGLQVPTSTLQVITLRTNVRGKDDHAQLHALMEYSGHLIDQCEDILALRIYDELTKSQVVRCRKTRSGGVHVPRWYM